MAIHKKIRIIPVVIILAGLAAAAYLYLHHPGLSKNGQSRRPDFSSVPDVFLTDIRQETYENGRRQWTLRAASARLIRQKNQTIMQNLSLDVSSTSGDSSRITADRGKFFLDSGDAEIAGNVLIDNDRYEIQAETLQYREQKRIMSSQEPVVIISDSSRLTGDTMIYDLRQREAILQGNVTGLLDSPPGG